MGYLIWAGAALALLGVVGLVACGMAAIAARRAAASDAELRDRLARLIPLNFGALALSVLGLLVLGVALMLG